MKYCRGELFAGAGIDEDRTYGISAIVYPYNITVIFHIANQAV